MRLDENSAVWQFLENGVKPKTAKPGQWYVRVKPYNRRTGHLAHNICFSGLDAGRALILREVHGWRILNKPAHRVLRTIMEHRNEGDLQPHSCDVCTFEEGQRIEVEFELAKQRKLEVRAGVSGASILTTSDLPTNQDDRDVDRDTNLRRMKAAELDDRQALEARKELAERTNREADRARLEADRAQIRRELEARGVSLESSPEPAP